ncbi:hypothetical protein Hanom_Chr04g00326571 [Helianthus anomalus]
MFVSNCRRCPLPLNLMSFVLNVSKSCMLFPLSLTQLVFFIKLGAHKGSLFPYHFHLYLFIYIVKRQKMSSLQNTHTQPLTLLFSFSDFRQPPSTSGVQ